MLFTVEKTSWLKTEYYTVIPDESYYWTDLTQWYDIERWCITKFGRPGNLWNSKPERYYLNSGHIFFRNEKDLNFFTLRWS